MEALPIFRMLGSLGIVLGMLGAALWIVRRFNLRLPGRSPQGLSAARLELVERIAIDARRSVILFRRDGREHLILLGPDGSTVVESGICVDEVDQLAQQRRSEAQDARRAAQEEALQAARAALELRTRRGLQAVVGLVQQARDRLGPRKPSAFASMVESPSQAPTAVGSRRRARRQRGKAA